MRKKSVWDRTFFPVLLTYFFDNFGQAIVYPIFTPLFLKTNLDILGASLSFFHRALLLGLLIASFPLAQFFGAPLLGAISDRIGRRRVFLVTLSGAVAGYFLTGVGIHFRQVPLLWGGRLLAGFFAGNLTICLAAIADITHTKEERSFNFGWIGTLGGLGFVLAVLAGGALSNPHLEEIFNPDLPFFLTSFFSLITLGVLYFFYRESHLEHHDKIAFFESLSNIKKAILKKGVKTLYLTYFLFTISWVTSLQFLSAYLIHDYKVSQNTITFTFLMIGITWAFSNFVLNRLLTKVISPITIFLMGLFLLSIALFLTLIPHQPLFLFLIHFFIASLAAALSWTNGLATLSLKGSKTKQGSLLGVNQSLIALSFILSPLIGGLLAGIDIHKLYLFTAVCALFGSLLLFKKRFDVIGE